MRRLAMLALAALIACGAGGGATGARGVVRGRVTAGPTCPVERAGSPCPEQPVRATLAFTGPSGSATTTSDAHGDYEVRLPAGDYTVRVSAPVGISHGTTERTHVDAGRTTTLNITLDTGIR